LTKQFLQKDQKNIIDHHYTQELFIFYFNILSRLRCS